jgi:hypothetical protein
MARTNLGADWQARALGALTNSATGAGATSITATSASLTGLDGTGGTGLWNGQILAMNGVYGVILSNTAANPTVVTIDRWYNPATPGGAAATTPTTATWVILPGMAPAQWMGITVDTGTPAATDTTLTSEETANGLGRAYATYAHTTSAASYTLTKAFTYTGSTSKTLHKIAVFLGANGSIMPFIVNLNADAIVAANGDSVTVTETVST